MNSCSIDENVEDVDERTELHVAAEIGADDVTSCLLTAHPDVDKVNYINARTLYFCATFKTKWLK